MVGRERREETQNLVLTTNQSVLASKNWIKTGYPRDQFLPPTVGNESLTQECVTTLREERLRGRLFLSRMQSSSGPPQTVVYLQGCHQDFQLQGKYKVEGNQTARGFLWFYFSSIFPWK